MSRLTNDTYSSQGELAPAEIPDRSGVRASSRGGVLSFRRMKRYCRADRYAHEVFLVNASASKTKRLTAIALLFKQRRKVLNSEVVPGSRPAAFATATDPRVEIFRRIGIGCQRLCGRQPNGEAPGYAVRNGRQLTDNKASGSGSRRSTPWYWY